MHKRLLALALVLVLMLCVLPATSAFAASGGSVITLQEQPATDPNAIKIVKESNGKPITDGEAIFKVSFYPNSSWSGSPARTWYYKTISGECWLGEKTYYLDSCEFGTSDSLYTNQLGMPTLPLGTVRVSEVQAPVGYLRSDFQLDGAVTQNSSGSDASFHWTSPTGGVIRYEADAAYVHNEQIKGNFQVIKQDGNESIPLANAGFRLFDSAGSVVGEAYSDSAGKVTFTDLPYGDYTYREFSSPKGYKLDDTVYSFSIRENGVTVSHTRNNVRREGTIQVMKQDSDGSALAGAVYLLEYSTDKGSTWSPVEKRDDDQNVTVGGCTSSGLDAGQLSTGADGTVTFTGLRADENTIYRLTETKAPNGFALIGEPLFIGSLPIAVNNPEIADNETVDGVTYTYTLYVTATDGLVFKLPETGHTGFFFFIPTFLLTAAFLCLIKFKTKEITHESF